MHMTPMVEELLLIQSDYIILGIFPRAYGLLNLGPMLAYFGM